MSKKPAPSWSPYLLSLTLIAVLAGIFYSGIHNLIIYKRAVNNNVPVNLENIHFFVNEHLERQFTRLTSPVLPAQTDLASFYIYADERDFNALDESLPESGKSQYIQGQINVDGADLISDMQFRYRGGLPMHWLYDKKSVRVKLPPFVTYLGERKFNLVNPSTIPTIVDLLSYDMARSLGLLTPDYFPARVYFNDAYNGLHFFLSHIDESFLRKNRRMPGSIYSGDTLFIPNPFGGIDSYEETQTSFTGTDDQSLIWKDIRLWDKPASRNAEMENDRSDIVQFIETINQVDPLMFQEQFNTYFDKEKYFLFWGLDTLVGSYHHDNFHNQKMYFDPYKGKFEPIEWDIRFWSSRFLTKDLPVNQLLWQIILNPVFEFERDRKTYELMELFPVADIHHRIDGARDSIIGELRTDPYLQGPDSRYPGFVPNKVLPISTDDIEKEIADLKLKYRNRSAYLNEIFSLSRAEFTVASAGPDQTLLTISVNENSPIDVYPTDIVPQSLRQDVSLYRLYKNVKTRQKDNKAQRLYPGRKIRKGNTIRNASKWTILAFGNTSPEPSPLHYQFLLEGVSTAQLLEGSSIVARNSITGEAVELTRVGKLPPDKETASVHPWELPQRGEDNSVEVALSGTVTIDEDLVFARTQQVTIAPGTVFNIAPGRSLVFYGRLIARGTAAAPIIFRQKVTGEPWGSIVIQGQGASGSQLSHVNISGGSVLHRNLINYPGEINIHDVDAFHIDHCMVSNNSIGDDAMHIAYSTGDIHGCRFAQTAFDALDIDIGEVAISDTYFTQVGNDALDLMTSSIDMHNIYVDGAGDKCISAGEDSNVTIRRSLLKSCEIGIAVKDQSKVLAEDLVFQGNRQGVSLYQKNSRYNRGGTITGSNFYGLSREDIYADPGSRDLIPSEQLLPEGPGAEKKLALEHLGAIGK